MKKKKDGLKENVAGIIIIILLVLGVFEMACDDARPIIGWLYIISAGLIVFVMCDGPREIFMDEKKRPSK